MNVRFLRIGAIVVAVGCCFWLAWMGTRPLIKYRETKQLGDITVSVDVCLPEGTDTRRTSKALEDIWQLKRDIQMRMAAEAANSDVARINSSYQNPQKMPQDTYTILQQAVRYRELTRGAYDLSVKSLMDLWSKCERENRLPTEKEILEAKSAAKVSNLKFLLGNRVAMMDPRTRVDLAGISSGFAVDQAVKAMRKKGFRNFLIDAEGEMFASGKNCSRRLWTIAIRNPNDSAKIVDVIRVSDAAVSTTGGFRKTFTIQGQRLSRIINPLTGVPQKDVLSATVIAPSATENDALSEALCVLSPDAGKSLIDSMGRAYASVVITKDKQGKLVLHKSDNYGYYQFNGR